MASLTCTWRRRLQGAAFGVLFVWVALATAWAGPAKGPKTVVVGPPQAVRTAHGVMLRPTVAVADRVLVRLTPAIETSAAERAVGRVKGRFSRRLCRGTYVVELPAGSDVVAAAAALRSQPGVLVAEPDVLVYPALVPDDPQYSQQYHLPLISAPQAWNITTGSSSVVIAIVDSGVDLDHPDLASKIWINTDEIAGNGKDDDHNGYVDDWRGWDFDGNNNDPNPSPNGVDDDGKYGADDEAGHGTLVAGVAAAVGNDGFGTAGVDWGAQIMALQVFPDDGGAQTSVVLEAINYATANGANIINLSIGASYIEAFTDPITQAYEAGVLVVSAGGNSSKELTNSSSSWKSPVCNDGDDVFTENHVLGVGATDRNDRISWYSNYDSSTAHFIDVMAPGDDIYGPAPYFPSIPGFTSYFGTNSGTSFSCPIVSGLAALLKGRSPGATPDDLIAAISGSGDNIDQLNAGYEGKLGGGRVNCARALGVALPPAVPQDFAAADTTGDDGGSVTLTWTKSSDDGVGTEALTAYEVLRRQGTTGALTQIATLPPGTVSYDDTGVTDGVDYYYQLRVTDGTLTDVTSLVGPVQSRNDQAPATVSNVRAADRADDSGGAIVVAWDAYSAPDDFAGYTIYRSTRSFTSTSSMTPLVTLTNGGLTSYVDTLVSDGVDYYYAVGARDTAGNEARALASYGPVQSYSNTGVNFAAGMYFMAMPAVPEDGDPATLFGLPAGSFAFARWSPDDELYLSDTGARPLPALLQLELGRGYWVKFPQAVNISPVGISAPAGDFDLELTPGWHQIGNPFFSTTDLADATVTYNGAAMDLISAHTAGIMAAFAWTYSSSAGEYDLVYPPLGSEEKLVAPWQGIWVLVYKSCRLTLGRPIATQSVGTAAVRTAQSRTAATRQWQVDWTVGLRVKSGSSRDSECLVGAASQELLAAKPPPALEAPVLTLAAPGAQRTGKYAVSLAQSGQTNIIWNMQVENLRPGREVTVTAPDLSSLPHDSVVLLEDLANGRTVYLRTVSQYVFTPASEETARSFRLTVAPRSASALAVQSVVAQGVRQGGAAVSFTLSSAATCTVSVLNIAGRTVRVLEEGKLHAAGNSTVLWDGRSALGTRAPSGMYLLQVSASGAAGENVRAMSAFRVQ